MTEVLRTTPETDPAEAALEALMVKRPELSYSEAAEQTGYQAPASDLELTADAIQARLNETPLEDPARLQARQEFGEWFTDKYFTVDWRNLSPDQQATNTAGFAKVKEVLAQRRPRR
jgi:hypothetical protein